VKQVKRSIDSNRSPCRFKKEIDPAQRLEYGLVAEDVAEVNPNLAIRNANGEIESVRYNAVNAMLLDEFLKERKAFLEEQREGQNLQATVAQEEKQIEALTATLQKLSAQHQFSNSTPRNNRYVYGSAVRTDN